MPLPARPATHIDWTDGSALKVTEPTGGKKLLGWTKSERPAFQYMNWLFFNLDEWIKWAEDSIDDHETRLAAAETTIGTLGNASSITASNSGHTYLTGLNVQAQLDQTDSFLEDLANAITQGKGADIVGYIMGAPANWSPSVDHVGDALDQLADRVNTLENLSNTGEYIEASFDDYVAAASTNTGLTDNSNTNPRGLKFNDLKYIEGEEVIECTEIGATGNFDANGLAEFEIVAPRRDPRIRFYGLWHTYQDQNGRRIVAYDAADESNYILVTGVFNSIGFDYLQSVNAPNDLDVLVDNVDTGVNLSMRHASVPSQGARGCRAVLSDASLSNLGMGLHTVKMTVASSDTTRQINIYAIRLVGTARYQLGGQAWVEKNLSSAFAVSAPSAPSVTNKGGRVLRYIDPADSTLKFAVQNCTVIETSASSIGSGAGSVVVTSATGFQAGDIVLLTDGPNNSELIRVSSVNIGLNTLSFSTNTQNSYTSATVALWGRTGAGVTHANEEVYKNSTWYGFGESALFGGINDVGMVWSANGSAWNASGVMSDGANGLGFSSHVQAQFGSEYQQYAIYANSDEKALRLDFVGTGVDLFFNVGTNTATMRVILDGVELAALPIVNSKDKWYKICSDLPEGSHVLQIENDDGGSYEVALMQLKIYRTKKPTVSGVSSGNILAEKFKSGSPLFLFSEAGTSSKRLCASRGIIKQHVSVGPELIQGTGGTFDWIDGGGFPLLSIGSGGVDESYYYTDRTGGKISRWFYGTGVEVLGSLDTTNGIAQVKLDGSNMTTANFGSATFHAPSGSGFNATSGEWDQYGAAATASKFGISGLTEGWHKIEVEVTGNKNGSSSGYILLVVAFNIFGMDFDCAARPGSFSSPSTYIGAIRDVRRFDQSTQLEFAEQRIHQRMGLQASPSFATGLNALQEINFGNIETKPGEALRITFDASVYQNTANAFVYANIVIDGRALNTGEGTDSGPYASCGPINKEAMLSWTQIVNVAPGFHDVKIVIRPQDATTATNNTNRRIMTVEPIMAVRSA